MKQTCVRNKEFRAKVVESALKIGICRAASVFAVSRVTVSKWIKKFHLAGETGLCNRSRKDQQHPNRLSDDLIKRIIDAKTLNPDWSSLRLIRELNLRITPATVLKKIRQHFKEYEVKSEVLKIFFDTTPVTGKAGRFYRYLLSAKEETSGVLILGFTNENIALSQAVFADFVLSITGWGRQDSREVVINIGNGRYTQPGRDRGAFVKLLKDKYGLSYNSTKAVLGRNRDLADIAGNLQGNSRSDVLLNCCLLSAQINLAAKAMPEYLSFLLPYETDSSLKWFSDNVIVQNCFTERRINPDPVELLTKILVKILEVHQRISDELYLKFLQILTYFRCPDINAESAFVLFCNRLLTGNLQICRNALDLFKQWLILISRESQFCYKLEAEYCLADGNMENCLKYFLMALDLAEKNRDMKTEAELCGRIGNLHKKNGNNDNALSYFNRQESLAKKHDFPEQLFFALLNFGYYYASTGDFEHARYSYLRAHNQAVKLNNLAYQADALSRLGNIYLYRNDLVEAEKCFLPLIELGRNNKDLALLGESYNKMAMLLLRKHDYTNALENALQYYNISEKKNNSSGKAVAQRIMGICFMNLGHYRRALNCFKKDLQISRLIRHQEYAAVAIGNIGTLYLNTGHPVKALFAFQTQQVIAQELKNMRIEYTAVTNSGIACLKLDDYKSALVFFNEQMTLSKRSGEKLYLALAYQGRAQAYLGLKDFTKSLAAIRNAIRYFDMINDKSRLCEASIDLAEIKSTQSGKKISNKKIAELDEAAKRINRNDLVQRIAELKSKSR